MYILDYYPYFNCSQFLQPSFFFFWFVSFFQVTDYDIRRPKNKKSKILWKKQPRWWGIIKKALCELKIYDCSWYKKLLIQKNKFHPELTEMKNGFPAKIFWRILFAKKSNQITIFFFVTTWTHMAIQNKMLIFKDGNLYRFKRITPGWFNFI